MTIIKVRERQSKKSTELDLANVSASLLETLEEKNIQLPFGCRSGACGACRVIFHKGLELMTEPAAIEKDTLARCQDPPEVRLACRAHFKKDFMGAGEIEIEPAPEVTNSVLDY